MLLFFLSNYPLPSPLILLTLQTLCTPISVCGLGTTQLAAATIASDVVCIPCTAGSFKPKAGSDACTLVSLCPDGYGESVPATPTSDRACSAIQNITIVFDYGALLSG